MTRAIGVEVDCPFSGSMLRKVVYAGSQSASFVTASKDLEALAEAPISRERVERWTKRVGSERVAEVEARSAAYQQLDLPARRQSPSAQIPAVACVQVDGGRIQIRSRQAAQCASSEDAKGHWRETLVGCLLSMTSREHAEDPCPHIPQTFVDPQRMSLLSREIKGFSADAAQRLDPPEETPADRPERPQVLVKSVVATRAGIEDFGERLIASAYARGFGAAARKAFVADGSATNWSIHRKHFSHYTPILDFTHAICYVWAAALAGRSVEASWDQYVQWAQWLWEGKIDCLIEAVAARSGDLGPPQAEDESSPAATVAKTLTYLNNQQSRMNYPAYRKAGLPITSSHIESTIKQINRRVKGTEKFWDSGAEPLLQLAADHLSETNDFPTFWTRRRHHLRPMRCYRIAA